MQEEGERALRFDRGAKNPTDLFVDPDGYQRTARDSAYAAVLVRLEKWRSPFAVDRETCSITS